MNQSLRIAALTCAVSLSTSAYAQSTNTTDLSPIIVSGGISPIAADRYGRSASVITRQEIEERGLQTVQDALEALPGVSINGSGPSDRQIRIRGGEGSHTLVLIDGVRAASGSNEYKLRSLDMGVIERIELLRGPQSVPYGSDASTGVVNIITRQAGSGLNAGGSVEVGEVDRQNAHVTYGSQQMDLSLTASNLYDEGYDFSNDGGERDSTQWQSITSKARIDLTNRLSAGLTLRLAEADFDLDEDDYSATTEQAYVVDDPSKAEQAIERLGSVYLAHQSFNGRLGQRIRFDQTLNDNSIVADSETQVLTYRLQYAFDQASIDQSDQLMSVLVERKTDSQNSSTIERENDSVGLEYTGFLFNRVGLQAGIRHDDNSAFAGSTTWNIASTYWITDGARVHASMGRAVVNPTFFEITGGSSGQHNGDLEPEKNEGFDVGIEWPISALDTIVDLTYFNETLTNEIYSDDFVGPPYDYDNEDGDSEREGVEVSATARLTDQLKLRGQFTYIDATDPDGKVETRRAQREWGVGLTWRGLNQKLTLNSDLRYVNGLYDGQFWSGGESSARLPNYTVVDFSAQYQWLDQLAVTARLDNAFDEDNKEVWGFGTRGRAAYIGVRAEW